MRENRTPGLMSGEGKTVSPLALASGTPRRHRRLGGLTLTAYNLPRGTIASYYPECNVLVPVTHHDQLSQTPALKSVPVRVEAG